MRIYDTRLSAAIIRIKLIASKPHHHPKGINNERPPPLYVSTLMGEEHGTEVISHN